MTAGSWTVSVNTGFVPRRVLTEAARRLAPDLVVKVLPADGAGVRVVGTLAPGRTDDQSIVRFKETVLAILLERVRFLPHRHAGSSPVAVNLTLKVRDTWVLTATEVHSWGEVLKAVAATQDLAGRYYLDSLDPVDRLILIAEFASQQELVGWIYRFLTGLMVTA